MTTWCRRAAAYLLLLCLPVMAGTACDRQPGRQSVFTSMDCEECAIVLEPIAVLGAATDTIWPVRHTTVVQDRAGSFYLGITDHPGVLAIYAPTGRFLRTFGRRGQGPGEYDSPLLRLSRGPADTIIVVDMQDGRRTVIDRLGQLIRTDQTQQLGFTDLAWLQDGRMIVVANIRTPDLVGKPLHEVAADGRIIRSFGEFGRYTNPELHGHRRVAPARDGGLWVAFPNRYRIEHYDAQLQLTQALEFELPWFPPYDAIPARGEPPATGMAGVWENDDGLLWVILRTADARWEDRDPALDRPEQRIRVTQLATLYDFVIEVIDPIRGARIASQRFDELIWKGSGDDLVYGRSERALDGGVVITAFRPHLRKGRVAQ